MRKSRHYYSKSKEIKQKFLGNKRIVLLIALFAAGVVAGTTIINGENHEVVEYIISVFKTFILQRNQQKLTSTLLHSAMSVSVYLAVSYLFGLCVIGVPAIGCIPFVKGLGLGVVLGYLYSVYKWKGIGYSLLIIFPGALVSAFALILACSESIIMSMGLFSILQGNKTTVIKNFFKMYNVRYLIFFMISMASALFDAVLVKTFGSLFSF